MNEYLQNAKEVIIKLKEAGYDAYMVGGFVRDHLLGIKSDDIDITTSATPLQVESLFEKVKQTGKKFGGVTVIIDSHKYEVTTFRLEGSYMNHRYPSEVSFSMKVEDDIKRRDFTINAFLMDEYEKVYDYHNGQDDLDKKIIRTINNPKERFTEDALRILRAFRFVSKLGFDIESSTLQAITDLKHLVKTITIERVMIEMDKIISGDFQKKALQYMLKTGVSKELFGLHNGIEIVADTKDFVYPLELFTIANVVGELDSNWRFSNNQQRVIERVSNLHEVTRDDEFNKFIIFSNKLDICLMTNKINVILGYKDQADFIVKMWNDMPVKDVCDLAFKGQDILQLTTLHNRRLIALVIDDLLFNVIMGIMPNEYEVLKDFSLQKIKELQKEMGETNE